MRIRTVSLISQGAAVAAAFAASQDLAGAVDDPNGLALAQTGAEAEDDNGIALLQAPTIAVPLTLEAVAADLDQPRFLTWTSAGDLSSVNFEIIGTDKNGAPQTDTFAGPFALTNVSDQSWGSVTSITPDASSAVELSIGWAIYWEPLTLEAVAADLDPPRLITLTSADDFEDRLFAVVGTDADGNPQGETMAGPFGGSTVTSTLVYGSVTSIIGDPDLQPDGVSEITAGWPLTDGSITVDGMTLEAAAADIDPPRELTMTSGADLSGITFTIYGLDRHGHPFTEEIAGPVSNTIKTRGVYSAVLKIVPNDVSEDTLTVGYPARVCSAWIIQDTTRAQDGIPIAKVQALPPDPGNDFGTGIIEMSEENAARLYGEQARPETATLALATAGAVAAPQAAWFRLVNTSVVDGEQLKAAIARPSF